MATEISDAFNTAFRDFVTDGVPSSGKNPVIKAEARAVGPIIQSRIDGYDEAIADLVNEVSVLAASQGKGSVGADTKANADTLVGPTGLNWNNTTDKGKQAEVYNDPDPAKNGVYTWSGTALVFQGLGRLGALEAATGAPVVSLGRDMVWDRDGSLNSGAALQYYVPLAVHVSIGSTTFNGNYGTASTVLPTHVALTVSDADTAVVYLDLDDTVNPQKIANYPTLPSKTRIGRIVILAVIRSYKVVWSIAPVTEINDMQADRVLLRYPLVAEKDKILVPTFYHIKRGDGISQVYTPADGSRYWELNKQTSSGTEDRIVFNRVAAEAGQVPVKLVSGSVQPRSPGKAYVVEIASAMTREIRTEFSCHGYVPGGLVPNQFETGDAPDEAYLYSSDATTVVDITDPDLIALGFTRGVSGDSAFYGGPLPENTPLTGYIFARLYVEATVDDTWGTPRVYIQSKTGVLAGVDLILEKRISARAAIFCFFTQYTYTERPTLFFLGQFQTGTARVVAGGQIYLGAGVRGWIARDDRPIRRRADVLYGSAHHSIVGREIPFFPSSILAERDEDGGGALTISKTSGNTLPYIEEHRGAFELDYTKAGSAIKMTAAGRHRLSGMRFDRTVSVVRKTGPVVASPKILAIGDSITLFGLVPTINAKLADMGLTPSWAGTIKMLVDRPSTYSTLFAEGRSGWALGDFTYSKTAQPPVAVGDEAVYLARSSEGTYGTTRHQYNPLIRDSVGGDSADIIRNGKVFDPRFYFDRFSGLVPGIDSTDPDIVLLGLLTNDINEENAGTALLRATDDMALVLTQTRAAFPAAKIGWWLPAPPRSPVSDTRWRNWYVPCIRAVLDVIADLGDADIHAIPAWAHMTVQSGYPFGTAETSGGQASGWVSDDLHPSSLNQQLIAETIAQWIACVMAP